MFTATLMTLSTYTNVKWIIVYTNDNLLLSLKSLKLDGILEFDYIQKNIDRLTNLLAQFTHVNNNHISVYRCSPLIKKFIV